jgi:hypothetical protein
MLPLPYSLALRLRDAGVAAEVICEYVDVDKAALENLYGLAEAKLRAAVMSPDVADQTSESSSRDSIVSDC